ncbi:MAG TPA: glycosyltransferase family 4 protein, partial [Planctomycetota bacterium]|nr:glycosyltransferase family 4 protein [Planctomycetota bacterium]
HGGLQLDFFRMLQEAVARGHEVTIITSIWEDAFLENVQYKILQPRAFSNHGFALAFEKLALAYLQTTHFDCVFGFNRMAGLDVYFAGDNCFRKTSSQKKYWKRLLSHRYNVFEKLEASIFQPLSSTKILYISPHQKQDYIHYYQTQENRFFYLPPGIDPKFHIPQNKDCIRSQVRKQFHISDNQIVLIQVCSAFYTKGVDRNLYALHALPKEIKERCIFLVVGSYKHTSMLKLANLLKIQDKVIFTGVQQNVEDFYLAADCMIHPARNEAAGNVLIEALSMGLPVLCTENCGYATYVQQAHNRICPMPFQQDTYNQILQNILSNEQSLQQMKQDAIQFASTQDFYHRASKAIDYLEIFSHGSSFSK